MSASPLSCDDPGSCILKHSPASHMPADTSLGISQHILEYWKQILLGSQLCLQELCDLLPASVSSSVKWA